MTEESPSQRLIVFLPWLKLTDSVRIGDVDFLPFKDTENDVHPQLAALEPSLTQILSGYVDVEGRPAPSCTVATLGARTPCWNLTEEDFESVRWSIALLSLACMSKNEFYTLIGCYVNSTQFQFFGQKFTEPVENVALVIRRRDGNTTQGGYLHGDVKFTIPLECSVLGSPCVDTALATSFNLAITDQSEVLQRLRPALSFFSLANTDAETMSRDAETILAVCAFEQLLEGYGARKLSGKLAEVLTPYNSVNVTEALSHRPNIQLDKRYEAKQRQWPITRKWMEELYHLRNDIVHGNLLTARSWGWNKSEHLVISAFVFPLIVKVLLSTEGHYTLSEDDLVPLHSIEKLLIATDWHEADPEYPNTPVWQGEIRRVKRQVALKQMVSKWEESTEEN